MIHSGPTSVPASERTTTLGFSLMRCLLRGTRPPVTAASASTGEKLHHAGIDLGRLLAYRPVRGPGDDPRLGARDRARQRLGVLAADHIVLAGAHQHPRANRAQFPA